MAQAEQLKNSLDERTAAKAAWDDAIKRDVFLTFFCDLKCIEGAEIDETRVLEVIENFRNKLNASYTDQSELSLADHVFSRICNFGTVFNPREVTNEEIAALFTQYLKKNGFEAIEEIVENREVPLFLGSAAEGLKIYSKATHNQQHHHHHRMDPTYVGHGLQVQQLTREAA